MRVSLAAIIVVGLFVQGSVARPDEPEKPAEPEQPAAHAGHMHSMHSDSAPVPGAAFSPGACPARDAKIRADMTALGIIERCADIELLPNMGGIKIASYLRVDAARAQANTLDGIAVETAPGSATFSIAREAAFESYVICNLDESVRSEVPRSGRFKPKHAWVYRDARMARYQWDVKARVSQGSTAPHLHVWAYVMAIPNENLKVGIERKWCRPATELGVIPQN